MENLTLATLLPRPKIGEWYLVKTHPKNEKKVLVLVSEHESVTQDTFQCGHLSSYFAPEKITYNAARVFLNKSILEKEEALEDRDYTQKTLLECMRRFYNFYFER